MNNCRGRSQRKTSPPVELVPAECRPKAVITQRTTRLLAQAVSVILNESRPNNTYGMAKLRPPATCAPPVTVTTPTTNAASQDPSSFTYVSKALRSPNGSIVGVEAAAEYANPSVIQLGDLHTEHRRDEAPVTTRTHSAPKPVVTEPPAATGPVAKIVPITGPVEVESWTGVGHPSASVRTDAMRSRQVNHIHGVPANTHIGCPA
jgi:hypothetical protein